MSGKEFANVAVPWDVLHDLQRSVPGTERFTAARAAIVRFGLRRLDMEEGRPPRGLSHNGIERTDWHGREMHEVEVSNDA